jgi:hypothetical protein
MIEWCGPEAGRRAGPPGQRNPQSWEVHMRRLVNAAVVVLIVLTGGGLVLAGLARAREEQARTTCKMNLRQLGLALHNYHDTYRCFPAATVPSDILSCEKRLSWYVPIFPYIEQIVVVLDQTKAWDAEENREPRIRFRDADDEFCVEPLGDCKLFLCPTNPSRTGPGLPAVTHYVGITGIGRHAADLGPGYPGAGVFGCDRRTRLEDITDGQAATLMVVETASANGPWTAGGPATARGLDPDGPPYLGADGQFGGTHRGGCFAAFADGSVRFLPAALDPRLFEALATIAGGEEVGPVGEE